MNLIYRTSDILARALAAINIQGQIVGSSETEDGETYAILWSEGVMIDRGTLSVDYSARVKSINIQISILSLG
jgi:probable HAF family extracellular repeat protein